MSQTGNEAGSGFCERRSRADLQVNRAVGVSTMVLGPHGFDNNHEEVGGQISPQLDPIKRITPKRALQIIRSATGGGRVLRVLELLLNRHRLSACWPT